MIRNTINKKPKQEWGHFVNLEDDTLTEEYIASIEGEIIKENYCYSELDSYLSSSLKGEKPLTILDSVYHVCNIIWLLINRH
jgi:hypothetical protein